MDNLERELLFRDMQDFGYQLVSAEHRDPESVLAKMLESNEGRVLEGVPVVLSNVLVTHPKFSLSGFELTLSKFLQKRFRLLAAVTFLFSFWLPKELHVFERLKTYLEEREPSLEESIEKKLRNDKSLNLGQGTVLDAERLERTFKNYVVNQFLETQESYSKRLANKRNEAFLAALAELFTDKQTELMFKLLNDEKLSKTDREHYSRTVKKRLKALTNEDVQSFATTLLNK